jgi:hypothetical protein
MRLAINELRFTYAMSVVVADFAKLDSWHISGVAV